MHNEEEVLATFFERVVPVLEGCADDYEIVCVDDGSRDATLEGLRKHRESNRKIRVVALSRNFGKEAALTCGLQHARMQGIIPIDADLQDPPEVIPSMVEKWREGYEVVYGTRSDRSSDGILKRWSANLFYRVHNALADWPIPPDTGDFRLMDRRVVDALALLEERNRFMKGLFAWVGFRQISVEYARDARAAGETKWNLWKLWNFALDGITASTTIPLRLASYGGLIVATFTALYFVGLLGWIYYFGRDMPGYASLQLSQLLIGSVQLMALGAIGEYLGRLYQEVKRRPLYLVDEVLED
jgi:glycosyltransferase involved in cell wall biosynthesis